MSSVAIKLGFNTKIRELSFAEIATISDSGLKQAIFHLLTFFDSIPFGNLLFNYKEMNYYYGYDINKITVQDVYDLLYAKGESLHYSLSTYSGYKRSYNSAVCNSGWTIDLDYYKTEYKHLSPQELVDKMKADGAFDMLEPSYIIYSGNGVYLVYLIKNINVNINQNDMNQVNIDRRRSIIKALIDNLAKYGADTKCHDLTRINKMVGTVNFKTGINTEIINFNKVLTTSLKRRTLGHTYNNFVKKGYITETSIKAEKVKTLKLTKEAKTIKREKSKTGKLREFKNFAIRTNNEVKIINPFVLNLDRLSDLEKLLEIRNNKLGEQHLRNIFLHLYSVYFNKITDKETVINTIGDINNRFDESIENIDYLRNQISKDDFDYHYKNESIIKLLEITDEEMISLKTIISDKERLRRNKEQKKAKRRNEAGLTSREQQKVDKLNAIKGLLVKGYKQVEIAGILGLDKKLISKYVKELKVL